MALTNPCFKDQIGLICEERTRREERRGEEEKEEKRKKGDSSQDQAKKVWKLNLCMDSMRLCMNFHALLVILLPKSRVFVRVHLNPKFMSSKVGKTPHDTR